MTPRKLIDLMTDEQILVCIKSYYEHIGDKIDIHNSYYLDSIRSMRSLPKEKNSDYHYYVYLDDGIIAICYKKLDSDLLYSVMNHWEFGLDSDILFEDSKLEKQVSQGLILGAIFWECTYFATTKEKADEFVREHFSEEAIKGIDHKSASEIALMDSDEFKSWIGDPNLDMDLYIHALEVATTLIRKTNDSVLRYSPEGFKRICTYC